MAKLGAIRTGWVKQGVARKLAIAVVVSLLVSFLVTATVSTWIDVRRQAAVETERLVQTARVIGSLSADAVRRQDRAGAFAAIRSVSQMPNVSYARLETAQGLLAETGGGTRLLRDARLGDDGDALSLWSILTTGSIEAAVPVVSEGMEVGKLTLLAQTPGLRTRVLATVWTTLAGALVSVVAGLVVALRLAERISRPIVDLAAAVRRLHTTRDFASRMEVKADGEVADLVDGFNALLVGIRERDARIAAHVEGLEAEVASRTAELVVARDGAEKANAAKSDFLAVMSHEIRTPLNGILALSEMLSQSELPPRQQRYAGVIAKSGKSLLSIINDILDFSKVEAGKMDLEAIETDLAEVAEDVASLFAAKAQDRGLDLAVFVHPRMPRVLADPVRLRQVIGNLVNNAIKFTETGGVLVEIEPTEAGVRVGVRDTGPGIPADRLPSLFEAFTQADQTTTRKFGGTGLGLAICDRLVRSMGGSWDLSSVVGEGSTFAFTAPFADTGVATELPDFESGWRVRVGGVAGQTRQALDRYLDALGVETSGDADAGFTVPGEAATRLAAVVCADEGAAAEAVLANPSTCAVVRPIRRADLLSVLVQMHRGEPPRLQDAARGVDIGLSFPGARVLVVDDSDVNREVASEALARLGVAVDTADDGLQAIERLRGKTYDMVLMDGSMPELDGFEATRRIRDEEAATGRPRVVVIALTAHVVGAGADAWRAAGMDGVIHKPFALADLRRELGRHCAAHGVADYKLVPETQIAAAVEDDLFDPVVRDELLALKTAGQDDFVQKIHRLYAETAPTRLQELSTAVLTGDQVAAARAAHALRSMSLSLGAAGVSRMAQAIEQSAEVGGATSAEVDGIRRLLTATLRALEDDLTPALPVQNLREALSEAMASDQIHLVYQPLVDRHGVAAGKVEALVRWVHPVDGLRGPDTFIPQLEAEGSIAFLTDYILARAMNDMIRTPDLIVAVNVSAAEFQQSGFSDRIRRATAAAGFPTSRLEIEVTETAILDVPASAKTLAELHADGISVSLDDFGAGYTSLHALRELPFNTLKIDRSFVERCSSDTASAAIIHAVIGVGRAMGMTVVCEGVETAEQAEFLRIAGVHLMQGYHFHRPLRLDDLPDTSAKAA